MLSVEIDQQKHIQQPLLQQPAATYYPAFLSCVASEMKKRIILSNRIRNGIQYNNVFDGKDAVDKLKEVLGVTERSIALSVGRSLESQRFFHDIDYKNRLIDDISELYQFNELLFTNNNNTHHYSRSSTFTSFSSSDLGTAAPSLVSPTLTTTTISSTDDEEDLDEGLLNNTSNITSTTNTTDATNLQPEYLPTGIYTELAHCYSPACNNLKPCYSYTCPKREKWRNRTYSVDTYEKRVTSYTYENEKNQKLWSQVVPEEVLLSITPSERKRQEIIFELIYTESDFLEDLNYVIKWWVEPLQKTEIIPKHRRNMFIDQVFSNIIEIRNISNRLTTALTDRQASHLIVSQISDIMENFVEELEPFIHYGSRQTRAKYVYEHERINNPLFSKFAEETERNPASQRLELNGFLTKPINRLGKYPLLLEKILDHTLPNHPDKLKIPYVIESIKKLLHRANDVTGAANNRFALEQIQRHLKFKSKKYEMDLRLLEPDRLIIKQGILKRSVSRDSSELQVILFDHYLAIVKKKTINAVDHYEVQKKPIPVEFLDISIPPNIMSDINLSISHKRNSINAAFLGKSFDIAERPLKLVNTNNRMSPYQQLNQIHIKTRAPITFYHKVNPQYSYTLFAPDPANRKAWQRVIKKQSLAKFNSESVFQVKDGIRKYQFSTSVNVNQMVVFDNKKMYLMATDVGVFCGQFRMLDSVPRMILEFEKVQQVHVLEKYQLLLVLADRILHHFPLDIVINGNPEQNQFFGRKIRSNVPYFHVGKCLDTTMIFVPKPYTVNGTEIDIYEPTMPKTEYKKKSFLGRLSLRTSSHLSFMNTQVNTLKPVYNPYNVWAIDNTSTLLLLSTHMGISAINMKTKKVDRLLDPKDELLYFVTKSQKIDEINPTKRVMSMFLVEGVRQYLICYDKYAFYIDKKGRRAKADFMITWEGNPTAFAYYHPYVMAFERNFIEIRDVDKGHLQQVIQEKNVHCLQNSHKSKEPIVLGSMVDKINGLYQHIFELQLIPKQQ